MVNRVRLSTAVEVAHHEAVIRQAYKDSVGVWTWSVGLTSATGHSVTRYIGKPQSMQKCLDVYVWALKRYALQVDAVLGDVPQHVYDAAVSFHWNTGAIRRASWCDHYLRGDMAAAEKAFKSWNKAGGKVSAGLVTRRKQEADLLFRDKRTADGSMTEYTRLTSRHTPDWKSAKKVDVSRELKRAFQVDGPPPKLDQEPNPYVEPDVPTLTPDEDAGLLAILRAFITDMFR